MNISLTKNPIFKHEDIEFCAVPVPEINDFKANSSVEFTAEQIANYGQSQTHPSIVYAQNGFGGHKWWLATTPYPHAVGVFEDPCIYYADDRANGKPPIEFTPINGTATGIYTVVDNPVVKVASNTALNSDPDIVVDNGVMWLISRDNLANYETFAQKSLTGQAWNERTNSIYIPQEIGAPNLASPAVIIDNGIKIYAITGTSGIYQPDYGNAKGLHYGLYILTGTTFEDGGDFIVSGKGYIGGNKELQPWHIDIAKYNNVYYMVCCAKDIGSSYQLPMYTYLATSSDGVNFYIYSRPIVDYYGYYRPTVCITETGELVIYISTTGAQISESDLPDGEVAVDGRYIGLVHAPVNDVVAKLKDWEWFNRT